MILTILYALALILVLADLLVRRACTELTCVSVILLAIAGLVEHGVSG